MSGWVHDLIVALSFPAGMITARLWRRFMSWRVAEWRDRLSMRLRWWRTRRNGRAGRGYAGPEHVNCRCAIVPSKRGGAEE